MVFDCAFENLIVSNERMKEETQYNSFNVYLYQFFKLDSRHWII